MPRTVIVMDAFDGLDPLGNMRFIAYGREIAGEDGTLIAGILYPSASMPDRVRMLDSLRQVDSVVPDCPHEPQAEFFHLLGVTDIVCNYAFHLDYYSSLALLDVTLHDGTDVPESQSAGALHAEAEAFRASMEQGWSD